MGFLSKASSTIGGIGGKVSSIGGKLKPPIPGFGRKSGHHDDDGDSTSSPAKKRQGAPGGDMPAVVMSIDDLDGPSEQQMEAISLVEEETPDLSDKGLNWIPFDWKLEEYHVRCLAFQLLAASMGFLEQLDPIEEDLIAHHVLPSLGIAEAVKGRLLKSMILSKKDIPQTSAVTNNVDFDNIERACRPRRASLSLRRSSIARRASQDDSMMTVEDSVSQVSDTQQTAQHAEAAAEEAAAVEAEVAAAEEQEPSPAMFVQYQLYLLMARRVEHFENPAAFQKWHMRQCEVVATAVAQAMESVGSLKKEWKLGTQNLNSRRAVSEVLSNFEELNVTYAGDQWWQSCEEGYPRDLDKIHGVVDGVCKSLASEVGGDYADAESKLVYPHPMAAMLYERLLLSCFDEDDWSLKADYEDVVEMIRPVRLALSITPAMHSICWAKMLYLSICHRPSHDVQCTMGKELKESARLVAELQDGPIDSYTRQAAQELFRRISNYFSTRLEKYHECFGVATAAMGDELEIFFTCFADGRCAGLDDDDGLTDSGPMAERRAEMDRIICTSVKSMYEDVVSDHREGEIISMKKVKDVINKLGSALDREFDAFSPVLKPVHANAMAIAARQIAAQFQDDLNRTVDHIADLDMDIAKILRRLLSFERRLHDLCGFETETDAKAILDLQKMCRAMVSKWVVQRRESFKDLVEIVIDPQAWEPIDEDTLHGPAVQKLFQEFDSSVEIFDQLSIPNSEPLLKPLLKGASDATEQFVQRALEGTSEAPMPVAPDPISKSKEKESLIDLFGEGKEAIYAAFESSELCVRLNSVDFAIKQLDVLSTRAKEVNSQVNTQLLTSMAQSLKSKCSQLRDFIAKHTVYYRLQGAFIKGLYLPSVDETRIIKIDDDISEAIGFLFNSVVETQQQGVVTNVLVTFVQGFEFILLNGGINRRFSKENASLFEKDVDYIENFFVQALPQKVVTSCLRRVRSLLKDIFSQPTKDLVKMFNDESLRTSPMATSYNLFRVIRHRRKDDNDSKKFIRHYKHNEKDREEIKALKP